MLRTVISPLRSVLAVLADSDGSRRLALGAALGMLLGLVPKGNLLAAVFSVVLLASRANLVAAALSVSLFTGVGMLLDPVAHRIGLLLLESAWLEPFWTWLYNQPLSAWTAFNNTVVLGQVVLGLMLAWPVYWLAGLGLDAWRPWLVERAARWRVDKVLARAESASQWSWQ